MAAERRARRLAVGLAAALLALVAVGAGGSLLVQHQAAGRREDRARRDAEGRQTVEAALDKAVGLRQQARWREAAAVLGEARRVLGDAGPGDLRQRLHVAEAELALVNRLDTIRQRRASLVEGEFDYRTAEHDYAAAFREAGLGEVGDDEAAVAARVRASGVSGPLLAALDDWAFVAARPESSPWLLSVARRAAPDAWGDRFRDLAVWRDRQALRALADEALRDGGAKLDDLSPQVLASLGLLMGGDAQAVPLLREAQRRHPSDFWLSLELGSALEEAKNWEEAVGYDRVAVALRPDASVAHVRLGNALYRKGDLAGAIVEFHKAIDLDPESIAHTNLGVALADSGDLEGAIAEHHKAIDLFPKLALPHNNLGSALAAKNDLGGAIAAYKKAIDRDPKYAPPHNNLGNALAKKSDLDGAIAEYKRAIDRDPKYAYAYKGLGTALRGKGDLDGAIAEYQKAIDSDPKSSAAYYDLGVALADKRDLAGAIAAYRKALDLDPKSAVARTNLGAALADRGDLDGAIAEYKRAIDSDPTFALAHSNLGNALANKGDLDGAIAAFHQAIDSDRNLAYAHGALGQVLLQQGRFAEARVATRRCLGLIPERDPRRAFASQQWQQCERLAALDEKLLAVLQGEAEPSDAAEWIALGQLCHTYKRRHTAAARFYAGAFAADPALIADLRQQHRYSAACSAALAAAGRGEDAKNLPDKVRQMLRRQALAWLRSDLALYMNLAERQEPATKQAVRQRLGHWQKATDLAAVRDRAALVQLPDGERQQWHQLWDDVAALLEKVEDKR
jgi:tetratricopeptide (TPR) repeat protein